MEVGSDSMCSELGSGSLGKLSMRKGLCMRSPVSGCVGAKGGMEDGKESDNTSDGCGAVGQFNRMALLNLNLEDYTRSLMISQICEPSVYVEEGLMQLLQVCYEEDHKQTSAMVLSGSIEHFESRVMEDLGWGCGWRNIQMLCSYLLVQDTAMKEALFGGAGFIPNIFAMQRWLEIAWAKGFDVAGADYFDWKISGTEKWIGTTECAALLRSFGVRAWIVDFQAVGKDKKDGPRPKCGSRPQEAGSFDIPAEPGELDESGGKLHAQASASAHGQHDEHGNIELCVARVEERLLHKKCELCLSCMEERKRKATAELGSLHITSEQNWEGSSGGGLSDQNEVDVNHKHMTNWIWNYFLDNKVDAAAAAVVPSITLSSRSPLYFQHQGHSRTIVGIERCHGTGGLLQEDKLIILDPSQQTSDLVSCLRKKQGWQNLVERGVHTLKQAEYQLCYIEPGIAVGEELESLKFLSTMRYKY